MSVSLIHMRSIPFRELQKHYSGDMLSEVKDKDDAFSDLDGKSSPCWSAGQILTGGWVSLARLSGGYTSGSKPTQFVCKLRLVSDHPKIKEKLLELEKNEYPAGYMQMRGAA